MYMQFGDKIFIANQIIVKNIAGLIIQRYFSQTNPPKIKQSGSAKILFDQCSTPPFQQITDLTIFMSINIKNSPVSKINSHASHVNAINSIRKIHSSKPIESFDSNPFQQKYPNRTPEKKCWNDQQSNKDCVLSPNRIGIIGTFGEKKIYVVSKIIGIATT